jgi:hypothetical protein
MIRRTLAMRHPFPVRFVKVWGKPEILERAEEKILARRTLTRCGLQSISPKLSSFELSLLSHSVS